VEYFLIRNMLSSYLNQFRMIVKLYRSFVASPFIWDDIKDNLVLLPKQNQTRIYYNIVSYINFSYVCLAIWSHFLLHRSNSSLETYILSFSFTILLVGCGFVRLWLVLRPNEMVQLYNCMLVHEKQYPGKKVGFI
jgi:hypothetical protein